MARVAALPKSRIT